jgi:hypothetical protein
VSNGWWVTVKRESAVGEMRWYQMVSDVSICTIDQFAMLPPPHVPMQCKCSHLNAAQCFLGISQRMKRKKPTDASMRRGAQKNHNASKCDNVWKENAQRRPMQIMSNSTPSSIPMLCNNLGSVRVCLLLQSRLLRHIAPRPRSRRPPALYAILGLLRFRPSQHRQFVLFRLVDSE